MKKFRPQQWCRLCVAQPVDELCRLIIGQCHFQPHVSNPSTLLIHLCPQFIQLSYLTSWISALVPILKNRHGASGHCLCLDYENWIVIRKVDRSGVCPLCEPCLPSTWWFPGLGGRPHPREWHVILPHLPLHRAVPRRAVPCSAVQSDPSLPSARFSTLLRQTGSAGARLRHRNPTQLEERGGGRETIPGMTRHLFSCQDKFLALESCANSTLCIGRQ